jgi:hypothetical protein
MGMEALLFDVSQFIAGKKVNKGCAVHQSTIFSKEFKALHTCSAFFSSVLSSAPIG